MPFGAGARLGQYEIRHLLGTGGMGDVYSAHDTRLQREVAVKVLRAAAGGDEGRARVWREARTAARVNHPGVCQIYDIGEHDDALFIVMELLTGEPLEQRLRDGALSFDESIRIGLAVLGAVDALHRRDVVHRDLKPSNVFLTRDGVKLLDFGLARSFDYADATNLTITAAGVVTGTPRYMAPEQWTKAAPDPRTDVFAVGLLLFEMLTGKPAFPGDDLMQVYHAVMSGQPPALSGSPVVAAVDAVIHRALEKRPDDRYQSAEAMAQGLRAAVSFTDASTQPPVRPTTRLVVLPFRMLRPDPNLEFLSFSLPDAIVSSLAGLQSLVVRSTHAGARHAGDAPDLKAIASELGVDAVVCGTLLSAGDQVRVSAQLLAAPSGTIIWSGTEQVAFRDLFQVQDQLARAVVESLAIPLSAREEKRLGRDLPSSARAYEFYLRGNQVSYELEMLPVAAHLYKSALDEDPHYAPAWAKLGRVYRLLAKYGVDGEKNLKQAEEAFARALAIDPDLSAAHNLYTYFEVESLGRPTDALSRLLVRLQSDAANPELFAGLVLACRYCGLLEASLAADRHARRIDPTVRTSVSYTHFMLGDWERAMAADVDDLRWVTNWSLPMVGREREAVAAYAQLERRPLPVLMHSLAAACRLAIERRQESVAALVAFGEQPFDPEGLYFAARAMVRVDEHDRALATLERCIDRGFFCVPAFVRDPWLDPLRSQPRFSALVRRAEERSREAGDELRRLGGDRLLGL